ncbi:NAD-dependent succinate-semialdehyde dehydrogenase [Salicibibacter cibarius]|uniref:Aldehyde dehydrogenase n=1 Tax=Salicibibacter cibarius TaxID=2743000 RepID=A0A7T7CDQ8_9BACI|nr:NAD-dependent succinate-semialdehyde dehydrogenase [Salicibibacter cibarius]QQK78258.1 NAD-dependent succinate-semialdehyde dehydrogenase [Salicibibacter cibarius]
MYIDGQWQGEELTHIEVINPATKQVVGTVPNGGKNEAKQAVDAAHAAFASWSTLTAQERGRLLAVWHRLIEENKEDIGKIMTMEQGKPLKEAIGEVGYANGFISWYAEEAKRIYGETIPASHANKRIFVQKQPVGVVAAITPWNFPAAMITRKVGPALAAGCTAVIKQAEETPLTALKLAELAEEAGIPAGVVNVITGNPQEIGDTWLEDERVRKITFTGSTEVGKQLMKGAAETVKKVSLELGGHAPFIVMEDADLDKAVEHLIGSKFRNSGQTCICTNRVYVQVSILETFSEKFKAAVADLTTGNGLEENVDLGPLINDQAIGKVQNHLDDATTKGGEVLVGGNSFVKNEGQYFEPTIISGASDDMLCMNEETFGPVAPIASFQTEEEVIQRANNSPFGLAAYVFSENIGKAVRVSEELEYGIVGVNDGLPSVPQAPFGGMKESGLGREGGHHGIGEYLEVKYISLGI